MPPLTAGMVNMLQVVCGSGLAIFLVLVLVFGVLRLVAGLGPNDSA